MVEDLNDFDAPYIILNNILLNKNKYKKNNSKKIKKEVKKVKSKKNFNFR